MSLRRSKAIRCSLSAGHGPGKHTPIRNAVRYRAPGGAMAIVFLTITPLGTGTPSVSRYVAGCERILRESGLKHELTAMGTIIEGDLDAILAVVRKMHESP